MQRSAAGKGWNEWVAKSGRSAMLPVVNPFSFTCVYQRGAASGRPGGAAKVALL